MTLNGRIGVEQLDEERLTNIERRIVAGAPDRLAMPARGARPYGAFAAAAVAALAAGVLGWRLHDEPAASPRAAQQLSVATAERTSQLALDGATVASAPGASYEITRGDGRVEIALAKGKLELAVEHRPDRVLIVRAGDTEIEDIGTKFSVDYDGTARATVVVTEGEIKVTRHQKAQLVAAGNAWTTTDGIIAIAIAEAAPSPPAAVAIAPPPAPPPMRDHHPTAPIVASDAPAAAKRPMSTAAPAAPAKLDRPPSDDLRARIASHAPELGVDLALSEYPLRAANETDLDRHAVLLFSWAVKAYQGAAHDAKLYDLADHVLDGLVAKRAGTRYVDALWLRLRIRCRRGYDDRCHDTARDYIAANGPFNDIAQDILSATR